MRTREPPQTVLLELKASRQMRKVGRPMIKGGIILILLSLMLGSLLLSVFAVADIALGVIVLTVPQTFKFTTHGVKVALVFRSWDTFKWYSVDREEKVVKLKTGLQTIEVPTEKLDEVEAIVSKYVKRKEEGEE